METKSIQTWPSGTGFEMQYEDGQMKYIRTRENSTEGLWREPTEDDKRAIKIEELAEMYANRDILHCDSCLVSDLLADEWKGEFTYGNVTNLTVNPDEWSLEECYDWLHDNCEDYPDVNPWEMEWDEMVDLLRENDISVEGMNEKQLREALKNAIEGEEIDGLDDWREKVRDNAWDHQAEVYEWWRVTKWLADNLESIGECVLDNNYGTWWGRTCTGQGLIMDGTLQQIAAKYT